MNIPGDLRQGWREFRSRPWVSAVAVVTLALGVAGATTMFTVINAVRAVMIPPGVDGRLVGRVVWTYPEASGARGQLTAEEFAQLTEGVSAFESVSASADRRLVLGGSEGPGVSAKEITADFFGTFGCRPSAGRLFTAEEVRASARVAVVSEDLLRRQLGLGLGQVARLGGEDYSIVGVLPDRCWFPVAGGTDVWLPMSMSASGAPAPPLVTVTGRLRSPASLELARSQVRLVGQRLAERAPAGSEPALRLITLKEESDKRLGIGAIVFLGPPLVVLLIACGNVANLLLARAARREREMAIRVSLGASRLRLVSERLAESAWLGIAGGALGVALSSLGVRLLRLWIGSFESARQAADIIHLDSRALLFAILLTLATPVVFGLVPALAVSKPNPAHALHQTPGWKRPRRGPYGGRDLLVIVEIGLAVVLVVATGMFTRFFAELDHLEWGFDPARVLAADLSFGRSPDRKVGDARLLAEIVEGARQLPGVVAAAAGETPDLPRPGGGSPVEFEGCASASGMRPARTLNVGPDYLAALGLPVRRGRDFTAQDTAGSPPVGVISEAYAARCWPGQDPIGRRFRQRQTAQAPWITIVGVVPDVMKTRLLPESPQPVYLPYLQHDAFPSSLLLRSNGDPAALAGAVRALVRRVDPTQPLDRLERLDESFRQRTGGTSLFTGILGGFSAFALALGALGVFSVMSYMVAERKREFGIRMALGASRRDVLRLVLGRATFIVAIGAVVSIIGTLAVTRSAFREMAELAVTDALLWISVAALLAFVALGASVLPARRATRVEPAVALRAE